MRTAVDPVAYLRPFQQSPVVDLRTTRRRSPYLARAGVRGKYLFVEGWMRNAFDTRYVPVAFAYPGLAPSGFIGESGRPRTLGITGGVRF